MGRTATVVIGTAVVGLAFAGAIAIALAFVSDGSGLAIDLGPWLPIRGSELALRVDAVSVPLLLGTAGSALLIAISAAGAHRRDAGSARMVVALDLLVVALLVVITARDLLLLLGSFGLVGVCAHLMLAHDRDRPEAALAAARALVFARGADAALLVATLVLLGTFQTVDLDQIADRLAISTLTPEASIAVFLASALVAVAALSRAAQVPFGVWLPAGRLAPSAPTAAVHVLVTASGAALLIRLGLLLHPSVILAAAAIGAGSASLAVAGSLSSGPRGRERWLTILPLGSVLAVLAVPGPATPFAASVLLGAVMIMRAALILGAPRPAASAGRPAGLGLDALYDRWIVPAVRWTTGVVVRGAEEAIEAIATSAAGVVVGAGVAARALQRGPLWVHEALLVAAALVIVVYWIVR